MANTPDLVGALMAARRAAMDFGWSAWQVPFGEFLPGITRMLSDQPLVTNGTFQAYLSFCAWVWQRSLSAEEQERTRNELARQWPELCLERGYSRLYDLVSLVWLFSGLQSMTPVQQEALRGQLAKHMPDGKFPGLDAPVPGATETEGSARAPAVTLRQPQQTGVALDGLYQGTTFGLQLNIFGPPGSGTWGSQTEYYAFFPDGRYMHFSSPQQAGAQQTTGLRG